MVQDFKGQIPDSIVRGLTKEHRDMLELYKAIMDAVNNRKYGAVAKYATQLHDQLHNHIHVENVKLYAGLKQLLEQADPDKRQMVHGLQREMFSIGRAAVDFMRQAETAQITASNADKFRADLENVGSILVRRIQQEEQVLYPLFLASAR